MVLDETQAEKRARVQEQQKPVAAWMREVMEAKGLKPTVWATKAKLGRDTVSRAVKDGYPHVSSTTTLIALAKAAEVAPPLHLLATPPGIPSAAIFARILRELLSRLAPERSWPDTLFLPIGIALRHTLLELAEEEATHDPDQAGATARMAARQQLRQDTETQAPESD